MISQELLDELKMIIKEDYQLDLQPQEVSEIAYTLVGFFELLAKIAYETDFPIAANKKLQTINPAKNEG